jgi:hypothetical protein
MRMVIIWDVALVSYELTDVSEMVTVYIFRAMMRGRNGA